MNSSVSKQISEEISLKEPGSVFSLKDFEYNNIQSKTLEQNLLRLKKKNLIKSICNSRGLYYKPKTNPLLGSLPPSESEIIKAYEKKLNTYFYFSGAKAANYLNLSTQIPSKSVYYTNKQLKNIIIGQKEISFKRKKLHYSEEQNITLLLLLSIEFLGKTEVYNKNTKDKIKAIIFEKCNIAQLNSYLNNFPKWISSFVKELEG